MEKLEYQGLPVVANKDILKEQEFAFLDEIDLHNYLEKEDWSITKIMSKIQEDHGSKYTKESYIFNAIEAEDFMEYIRQRYKGEYNFYLYTEIRVKHYK